MVVAVTVVVAATVVVAMVVVYLSKLPLRIHSGDRNLSIPFGKARLLTSIGGEHTLIDDHRVVTNLKRSNSRIVDAALAQPPWLPIQTRCRSDDYMQATAHR